MLRCQLFRWLWSVVFFILHFAPIPRVQAEEKVLIAYGGQNETVGPMWVAVDEGLFKKHGLEVRMLQMRSGQFNIAALMSGDVQAVWPAVSSVLSGVSGGAKISCVASPFNREKVTFTFCYLTEA